MVDKALLMSSSDEWETPDDFIEELFNDEAFRFDIHGLDPCAKDRNSDFDFCYTKEDDGLTKDWRHYYVEGIGNAFIDYVFVNPPFSKVADWVKKSYEESLNECTVVMLIEVRTGTKYWQNIILKHADEIRFLKGRLKFKGAKNVAPFDSAIVVFKPPRKQGKYKYSVWRR